MPDPMTPNAVTPAIRAADVSVVVCAYTDQRWDDLRAALRSLRSQTAPPGEIVVVIDHNDALLDRVRRAAPDVTAVANAERRGLSGARNTGVAAARGAVLAFLDDDAVAERDWLERLVAAYRDPAVIAAGGPAEAAWDAGRPRAFPAEFDWVVGCTYRGLPTRTGPVRNPVGANMSFRREVFETVGGFRNGIGRVGTRPVGCEETELCIRARTRFPDGVVLFEPTARVRHRVPRSRAGWSYFRSRCYAEGLSKALVTRAAGTGPGLASERRYALRTLPAGATRGLGDAVRGDLAGLARTAAILAGLVLTTAGYLVGTAAGRLGATAGDAP
jgi:glycosyltransferase involved in cell wall biosynthesis